MDDSILRIILDMPKWLAVGICLFVAMVLGAIYFHKRAGTSYGLMGRLYTLLIGRSEFHNPSVLDFWRQRKDVERFNALFHMRAKSTKDIERFHQWIEEYDLDVSKLSKLQTWFDFEKRKIKKIRVAQVIWPLLLALLFYLVALPSLQIGLANSALIKQGGEDQWIWLNHVEASNPGFDPFRDRVNDWRLNKSACNSLDFNAEVIAKHTGLSAKGIKRICKSFENPDEFKYIDRIINNQKYFLLLALAAFSASVGFYFAALRRSYVNHARRYLYRKLIRARVMKQPLVLAEQD